jgi:hypothetical protein
VFLCLVLILKLSFGFSMKVTQMRHHCPCLGSGHGSVHELGGWIQVLISTCLALSRLFNAVHGIHLSLLSKVVS